MTKQELSGLLARAEDLGGGDDFKAKIINDALAGKARQDLERAIDQTVLKGDHRGHGSGQGGDNSNQRGSAITSFRQVDDQDFFDSIKNVLSPL